MLLRHRKFLVCPMVCLKDKSCLIAANVQGGLCTSCSKDVSLRSLHCKSNLILAKGGKPRFICFMIAFNLRLIPSFLARIPVLRA